MMYQYKIQWLCSKAEAESLIKILGAKNLDKVVARGSDFKIIEELEIPIYGNIGNTEVIKWMDELFIKRVERLNFELLKK